MKLLVHPGGHRLANDMRTSHAALDSRISEVVAAAATVIGMKNRLLAAAMTAVVALAGATAATAAPITPAKDTVTSMNKPVTFKWQTTGPYGVTIQADTKREVRNIDIALRRANDRQSVRALRSTGRNTFVLGSRTDPTPVPTGRRANGKGVYIISTSWAKPYSTNAKRYGTALVAELSAVSSGGKHQWQRALKRYNPDAYQVSLREHTFYAFDFTNAYVNMLGLRANATPLVAPKDMAKHVASLRYKATPAPTTAR